MDTFTFRPERATPNFPSRAVLAGDTCTIDGEPATLHTPTHPLSDVRELITVTVNGRTREIDRTDDPEQVGNYHLTRTTTADGRNRFTDPHWWLGRARGPLHAWSDVTTAGTARVGLVATNSGSHNFAITIDGDSGPYLAYIPELTAALPFTHDDAWLPHALTYLDDLDPQTPVGNALVKHLTNVATARTPAVEAWRLIHAEATQRVIDPDAWAATFDQPLPASDIIDAIAAVEH